MKDEHYKWYQEENKKTVEKHQNDLSKYPKGILLDLGCRDRKERNFVGMDWRAREGVDIVHDLEDFPYPLDDETCLTIKAAHLVEHIKPWLFIRWMDEMWRLLVPNGQICISAPYAYSMGMMQDPTHCTNITDKTWQYFDPDYVSYKHYEPKPWKIEHLAWRLAENVEVILRKRAEDQKGLQMESEESVKLAFQGLEKGAMQKPAELAALLQFMKGAVLNTVVEIGTASGGVFFVLCKVADNNATLISIDDGEGRYGDTKLAITEEELRRYGKDGQTIHAIRKDSHMDLTKGKLLKLLNGRQIDLLFIDGDHTYEGVKKDYAMYSTLVKENGFIVFHDICQHDPEKKCEVDKFWKELKPNHVTQELLDMANTSWGGIGVLINKGVKK